MYSFVGYHGTNKDDAQNIIKVSFREKNNNSDWLGKGIYFFNNFAYRTGQDDARKWAYKSWQWKKGSFSKYSIIKCDIEVDDNNLVDFTNDELCVYFHKLREEYVNKGVEDCAILPDRSTELDAVIIGIMCDIENIDAMKKVDYVCFPKDKRLNISSRIPNCSILCIKKISCIKMTKICEVGEIDVRSKDYL